MATAADYYRVLADRVKGWFQRPVTNVSMVAGRAVEVAAHKDWVAERLRHYPPGIPAYSAAFGDANYSAETADHRTEYRKLIFRDPAVKASFFSKVGSVQTLDLQVEPADPSPLAKYESNFVRHCLTGCRGGMPGISWSIQAHKLIDGWAVCEPTWRLEDRGPYRGHDTLAAFKAKDTNFLFPVLNEYRDMVGIRATKANWGETFDPRDFVVVANAALFASPIGVSDLRAAASRVAMKEQLLRLRMRMLDSYAGPYLVGTYPAGNRAVEQSLRVALAAARGDGYLTLPSDASVTVEKLATLPASEFEAAIDHLDKEIIRSVQWAYLQLMESAGDVRGSTNVHKTIAETVEWLMAYEVCQAINEQLVPMIYARNFAPDRPYCRVSLGAVDPAVVKSQLEVIAAYQQVGGKVSRAYAQRISNIEPPAGPGDELGPEPQQPPGGMQLGPDGQPLPPGGENADMSRFGQGDDFPPPDDGQDGPGDDSDDPAEGQP